MRFTYDDGGRAEAGFKGHTGDCVIRAISIATYPFCGRVTYSGTETKGEHYQEVYDALYQLVRDNHRPTTRTYPAGGGGRTSTVTKNAKPRSVRNGVERKHYQRYLEALGWVWTPTMEIGSGCKVHLRDGELPANRQVICLVSKHMVAVVDGVIHDICDPSREGTRCVYGYYTIAPARAA